MAKVLTLVVLLFVVVVCSALEVRAQTTVFTYQGSLKDGANPASGNYDFEFLLFDALVAGNQIGVTQTKSNVAVTNGTFAVKLDFGNQFPGANRFIEVHVRPSGGGAFTPLAPRSQIEASPYAVRALSAATATTVTGPLTGSDSSAILLITNSAAGISPNTAIPPAALIGTENGSGGQTVGVIGNATSTNGIGVLGNTDGAGGGGAPAVGVYGIATSTSGPADGVVGETSSSSGLGVYGISRSNTGNSIGVLGDSSSPNGSALVGRSFGTGDILQLISSVSGGNPKLRVTAGGDFISLGNINATNGFRSATGSFSTGGTPGTPNFSADLNGNLLANGTVAVGTLGEAGLTAICRNASNQIATCSSSARYKSNINSFTSGLSLIKRLRPVSFNWKEGGMLDMGLIAEETNEVEPLLTTTNASGLVEGVKYDRVGVVLINAVKEQQTQIEAQNTRVEALEKQNQLHKDQIATQRRQIEMLLKIVCAQNGGADVCKSVGP